ncbi:hypothetical protein JOD54_001757 [Actinokineospora baliensis]|uniref:hypothetical protein n=1 Tax=Actinokineospora baliensis TaxID=547056 RepID=UPI0019583A76|nr:hypothetical protein [Actinokineospora baliensis]MBM7771553.1 hypothetical protein [Actinokineospora baliensis]
MSQQHTARGIPRSLAAPGAGAAAVLAVTSPPAGFDQREDGHTGALGRFDRAPV